MRVLPFLAAILPASVQCARLVLSNDDGWAEKNIRVLYDSLTAAGNSVCLSAPSQNESGTGSSDKPPKKLTEPCEYNSCPAGSPPYGHNNSNPRLNYVNSYPVTSMHYGINTICPSILGGKPVLAVSGFNVGANTGHVVQISGTVGAAVEAVKLGVPALAFSGSDGDQVGYTTKLENYQSVYATLSTKVTQAILASGAPYLPSGTWLNVNFPNLNDSCKSASEMKFAFTRILAGKKDADIDICKNGGTLPKESSILDKKACFATISVGTISKSTADKAAQTIVYNKLKSILTCP